MSVIRQHFILLQVLNKQEPSLSCNTFSLCLTVLTPFSTRKSQASLPEEFIYSGGVTPEEECVKYMLLMKRGVFLYGTGCFGIVGNISI